MSIIPHVILHTSGTTSVTKTYTLAFVTVILLYLADVWTVAYAFVPGGDLLRERTDMYVQQIALRVQSRMTMHMK